MSLVLRAMSLNEMPLSRPLLGRFDERGGQIGRSDNVTFTLPDPERMISRVQAQVIHGEEGYWLENVSAANPILHNGRALSSGMRIALHDGDEVGIGGYKLAVAFEDDETSATILRGRTEPSPDLSAPASAPPLASAPAPGPSNEAQRTPGAAPRKVTPRSRPSASAAGAAVSGEALWRGFVEGAGVELPLPNGPSPELLRAIGAMMKIAVEGIHRLVAMRAVAKSEMQADVTMIQVRGNNPLKFSPDATVALQLLLQPPARGFLAGPSALRDALIDLQSHQIGVMAGMRAALDAMLDRFDPSQLEPQLSTKSVLDSLVPAVRRAHLWELYLEHYRSLRQDAQEDFDRLFGEAFREAYEAQVRSLEAAGEGAEHPAPPAWEGLK